MTAKMNLTGRDANAASPHILMPLPDHDFDPTEAAIPWKACTSRGWSVTISTERGSIAEGDALKLKGPLPGLLTASAKARAAYREMVQDPCYQLPIPYAKIEPEQYQALLLPGGDTPRMRQYLESQVLQNKALQFAQQGKLIGAICHGVLVPARARDAQTGRSVLYGHRVTALPRSLDRFGDWLDAMLLKRGWVTHTCYVIDEVCACLEHPEDLSGGRGLFTPYAVVDRNLITARWYLDAELFAERFVGALEQRMHGKM